MELPLVDVAIAECDAAEDGVVELFNVMTVAGVEFRRPDGIVRRGPVNVDFDRLLRRDTLVQIPPGILDSTLAILSWADEALDLVRRACAFGHMS